MRIGRFLDGGREISGIVEGENVVNTMEPSEVLELHDLKFLPPVMPSKIVCVGLNYAEHARELGMDLPEVPILFLKPPSAVLPHKGKIEYPSACKRLDYEAELAIVIKERCKDISKKEAYDVILGYTAFNDVTARDIQEKDGQWTRSKSFDTFAPLGPWIVTKDDIPDPGSLSIRSFLNGKKKQDSNTSNLIFDIPTLLEFITGIMTLEEGDVIATGTPPGAGSMHPGDMVEVEIEGIGTLQNLVG